MRDELAIATYAIKKVKGINVLVTDMSIQMKAKSIQDILKAIEYTHLSPKDIGISRIISSIRIDERFDNSQTVAEEQLIQYTKSYKLNTIDFGVVDKKDYIILLNFSGN